MFVTWGDAAHDPEISCSLLWTKLKHPACAVEKAARVYGGDVSCLTDICRETHVFSRIKDITACLKDIEQDPELKVVQVQLSLTDGALLEGAECL